MNPKNQEQADSYNNNVNAPLSLRNGVISNTKMPAPSYSKTLAKLKRSKLIQPASVPFPYCSLERIQDPDERPLIHSVIEELQMLDSPNRSVSGIEYASLKNLDGMKIRKSLSYDKQNFELQFSKDNVVELEEQNLFLKKSLEEMRIEIGRKNEIQESLKKKLYDEEENVRKLEQKNQKLQKEVEYLCDRLSKQKLNSEAIQSRVTELQEERLHHLSLIQSVGNGQPLNYLRQINHFKKELENFTSKFEEMDRFYRFQIAKMQQGFEEARRVGQSQIDRLLFKINEKQTQIDILNSKMARKFKNISTHRSQNMIIRKDYSNDYLQQESKCPNYLNRFFNFTRQLEQKMLEKKQGVYALQPREVYSVTLGDDGKNSMGSLSSELLEDEILFFKGKNESLEGLTWRCQKANQIVNQQKYNPNSKS